jgi:prolyl-tRNA synthetase
LPIIKEESERERTLGYCRDLADRLGAQTFHGKGISVRLDTRDMNAGEKGWDWVKRGAPVTVEIGPRDMDNQSVFVGRRDKTRKERYGLARDAFIDGIGDLLEDIQKSLFARAKAFADEHTCDIDDWEEFQAFFTPKNQEKPEIHGGFALAHWCDGETCEEKIREELSVTIRCVPFERETGGAGKCLVCGEPSAGRVVFAKSY